MGVEGTTPIAPSSAVTTAARSPVVARSPDTTSAITPFRLEDGAATVASSGVEDVPYSTTPVRFPQLAEKPVGDGNYCSNNAPSRSVSSLAGEDSHYEQVNECCDGGGGASSSMPSADSSRQFASGGGGQVSPDSQTGYSLCMPSHGAVNAGPACGGQLSEEANDTGGRRRRASARVGDRSEPSTYASGCTESRLKTEQKHKHSKRVAIASSKERRLGKLVVAKNIEGPNSLKLVLRKRASRVKTRSGSYFGSPSCAAGLWDQRIPREILLKIFRHAVDDVGAFPFLITMQNVCLKWKAVAEDASLWEKVDISATNVTERHLKRLASSGLFRRVRELNISNFGAALKHTTVVHVISKCPCLEVISLAHNTKLSSDTIQFIVDHCQHLRGIDISGTSKSMNSLVSTCSLAVLKNLIMNRGGTLTQLCMAQNHFTSFNPLMKTIVDCLPHLQVFDISNVATMRDIVLPIEQLQEACRDLRVLRLATTGVVRLATVTPAEQARSPGFPELREVSVANLADFGDSALQRVVKTSSRLTLLDVRCCRLVTVSGLVRIPAWDLTELYISRCAAASSPDIELVMNKWAHSLRVIDLSWVSHETAIQTAVRALSSHTEVVSPLEDLDLNGSSVTFASIKLILSACSRLRRLNVTSCRSLPRGIKRLFEGAAVSGLRKQVLEGRFNANEIETD